jgi:hypothetical protein
MLRLQYSTWDALDEVEASFVLPPHLARAFACPTITARDFAARWKDVAKQGDDLRQELKACRCPRDLMRYLAALDSEIWSRRERDYVAAGAVLLQIREKSRAVETQIEILRLEARKETERALSIETQKGEGYRSGIAPLRARIAELKQGAIERLNPLDSEGKPRRLSKEERAAQNLLEAQELEEIEQLRAQIGDKTAPRASLDAQIALHRQNARERKAQARALIAQQVQIEKSAAARAARATRERLENEAELARLKLVRDAMWASDGLRYTNARPTAWWLPMVSPDGRWFEKLTQTAEARLEEL